MANSKGKTKTVRLPVTLVTKDGPQPPGTRVTLPADDADDYLARYGEAPAPAGAPEAEKVPAVVKPSGDDLTNAIIAAIGKVDLDDEDNVSRSGKPHVLVLERELGYGITADERNAAWEAFAKRAGS